MRIRKRNRILRRLVLAIAVVALVVPGAAKAKVDEGGQTGTGSESVVLADPKYGQSESGTANVVLADPKYGQTDERSFVELRDFPKSLPSVELGTYGMPAAGRNVYIETHSGKALVTPREAETPQVVSSRGFDWGDAGIGAGILAGLMIVLGGASVAARQLGRPQTA